MTIDQDLQAGSPDARVLASDGFWADEAFVLTHVLERFGFPPHLMGSAGIAASCLLTHVCRRNRNAASLLRILNST